LLSLWLESVILLMVMATFKSGPFCLTDFSVYLQSATWTAQYYITVYQ
jgi:hypothetical protein